MTSATAFKAGEFYKYKATVDGIHLGFINSTGEPYKPVKDETLQYDGSTVILKDGRSFQEVPQLRSAIRSGWFVKEDEAPVYRPKSAGIQVRDTEQRGFDPVSKMEISVVEQDERPIASVEDRTRHRERVAVEDRQRPAVLRTPEARIAVEGDPLVGALIADVEADLMKWKGQQKTASKDSVPDYQIEDEMADVFDFIAGARPNAPQTAMPSARTMVVDREEDLRRPVRREEDLENSGQVVGHVRDHQARLEQERHYEMHAAAATPPRPEVPVRRFGMTGVVVADQQHLGDIALSNQTPSIKIEATAQVVPSSTETIRTAGVEVGSRRPATSEEEQQGGVTVGRLLTPTRRDFVADPTSLTPSAITHALESVKKMEKVATATPVPVGTGDVEEPRSGDTLDELLPNAATPPKPVSRAIPPMDKDPAYLAAKALIPDFAWDRDRPSMTRVAEAVSLRNNEQLFAAIQSVETDYVRAEIQKRIKKLDEDAAAKATS